MATAPLVPGSLVREQHSFTVRSVVGAAAAADLPVRSGGARFYMQGRWPWRSVAAGLADWSASAAPAAAEVASWGVTRPVEEFINVAEVGGELPLHTYRALIGGAMHESFHRLWSRQGDLEPGEAEALVRPYLTPAGGAPRVPWGRYKELLLDLQNLYEDTAIERIGCAVFPGAPPKMAELADFVLAQERPSLLGLRGRHPSDTRLRIVTSTLRELGLGYDTPAVSQALDDYRAVDPQGVDMVLSGGLRPFLDRSIPDVSSPEAIGAAKRALAAGSALQLALDTVTYLHGVLADRATPAAQEVRQLVQAVQSPDPDCKRLDSSAAFTTAVAALRAVEERSKLPGEAPYRPYYTADDHLATARNRRRTPEYDAECAAARSRNSYLSSRLATLFRSLTGDDEWEHGHRHGAALSERHLADTFVQMTSGVEPHAAYAERCEAVDTSMAGFLVVDESGSMKEKRAATRAMLYLLGSTLDALRAPFMVAGVRTGDRRRVLSRREKTEAHANGYHRTDPVHYNLYKGWQESWPVVHSRMLGLQADESTPLADGIEMGLRELLARREKYRVLFAVTDGEPDPDHAPVIRSQQRRAAAAGILLVGVGLGTDSKSVMEMFPDHAYADNIDELPRELLLRLEKLVRGMRPSAGNR